MPTPFAFVTQSGFEWRDVPVAIGAYVLVWAIVSWIYPPLIRPIWWQIIHGLYRFRTFGREHVPATGPAMIVCNHVSRLDWMLLWLACPRPVTIMLWGGYYSNPIFAFWLSYARYRTVRIENRTHSPHATADALDHAAEVLNAGHVLLVFPEGRLTRNGQMRPFGRGIERILKLAGGNVPVIPACTDGMWGSVFSHRRTGWRKFVPENVRRRVCVWFGKPVKPSPNPQPLPPIGRILAAEPLTDSSREGQQEISPPSPLGKGDGGLGSSPTAPEIRAAVQECIADVAIKLSDEVIPVPVWFARSAGRWRNMFRTLYVDMATGTERTLTCGKAFVAAWALSRWLDRKLGPAQNVGLWLPTGMGSALANSALALIRRPTVNLNYTSGKEAVASACDQAGLTHVISSKRFEQRVPWDGPEHLTKLYLEDALPEISGREKLLKFLTLLVTPSWLLIRILGLHRIKPDDLLTIIFSSGSTGMPKGVMLTHRNIGSNGQSFHVGVDLNEGDVMMGTLPFFHSFGYTVCLWAPTCIGMKVVYYPDPRAAKEVGELTAKHKCSIVLGTATFLRFYLRRCQPTDFQSARLIICGAEKLPVKLAEEFHTKFGVLPFEGYGCTELSPVVCTNLPDIEVKGVKQIANRMGTVGQPIPGVVCKAFDIDTFEPLPPGEEGMLWCKGPNVMLGYLNKPEQTAKVVRDGWYCTGDLGLIEPDGFIRITGRLSRFAKIAGEMVPLEKIEEEMQELYGTAERLVAVAAVPDEKRGERLIVLFNNDAEAKLEEVLAGLPGRGLPNLWVPDRRDCYKVESFPVLGSGKTDLRGVNDLAKRVAKRD
jgi:acyl-[acyl-carrier-protein]-phospholipid O-acyltransferase/long-chain-fatty-acid--[acyl-carrier-protein] ligase